MIITIIGSMAFLKEYEKMKDELEKRDNKVITPLQDDYYKQEKNPKLASMQDFNKNLEKSDAILVANFEKHGKKHYIGVNSLMEIGMAFNRNKKIFILYEIPQEAEDELKAIGCITLNGDLSKIK